MEFAWSIQQQTADSLHVRNHSDYQEDSSAIGHSATRRLLSVAGKISEKINYIIKHVKSNFSITKKSAISFSF